MIDGLKSYPVVKSSGVPWLGEVPEAWNVLRGRQLFQIKKRIAGELGHPVLSVTQVGLRFKDVNSGEGQVSQDYSKYQIVDPGDFVMNSMDLLTGGVGIADAAGVTSPDYRVFVIRDGGQCRDKYVLFVLRTLYANRGFYAWGQGSAQLGRWRLPRKRFNEFLFPVPPPHEQTAIVRFLDHYDRMIRRYIAAKRKVLTFVEELRDAVTNDALRAAGTHLRLSVVVDVISRPINRTADHVYIPIGLFNRGRGIFHKQPTNGTDLGDSTFFWVQQGDLVLSGQFAWEGAVAMATSDDHDCIASHRYPILRGRHGKIETAYLLAFFKTRYGQLLLDIHSRGAAGRNRPLNLGLLLKEKIPVPSREEQKQISAIVEIESKTRTAIARLSALLGEYRTKLVSEVVTGKFDVREVAQKLPELTADASESVQDEALLDSDIKETDDQADDHKFTKEYAD